MHPSASSGALAFSYSPSCDLVLLLQSSFLVCSHRAKEEFFNCTMDSEENLANHTGGESSLPFYLGVYSGLKSSAQAWGGGVAKLCSRQQQSKIAHSRRVIVIISFNERPVLVEHNGICSICAKCTVLYQWASRDFVLASLAQCNDTGQRLTPTLPVKSLDPFFLFIFFPFISMTVYIVYCHSRHQG